MRLGAFSIVPILINHSKAAALAAALAPHLDGTTVVVASSDLSHYHPYERALSLDKTCVEAILNMDLEKTMMCNACGRNAILTLMHLARLKGWTPHLVDYKNSGDTGGGKDRVVGYTSIAFTDGKETGMERNDLPREEKLGLLKLARSAISAELIDRTEVLRPETRSSALLEKRGCFVTLHKRGQLRGCIGCIEPVSSLLTCVEEHARSAAFRDPRFPPVTVEELEDIDIEISVLTVPRDLTFQDGEELKEQLEPHVHGVILSRGFRKSTFLPQVWKQLPGKEEFLQHLCIKGGMAADAWKDPETNVQVYRAEAFGEKDT
jgi:AmmeMemoRadiSam system protein A